MFFVFFPLRVLAGCGSVPLTENSINFCFVFLKPSRRGQDKVEQQGQAKINVRLNQSNHNHNYNLMGFDTIEINL